MSRPGHQWDSSTAVKHMKIDEESVVPITSFPKIIDANEAERIIENLVKFDLNDVGSSKWLAQHRQLEKLNIQAHQNALSNSDEYISEALLTFNKIEFLIHDLLLIEAWKENIFPLWTIKFTVR